MTQRILIFDEPLASASETEDFELVVGRRQAAALTFLALVVVALCSGASYLAGKAIAPREEAPVPMIKLEQPPAPLIEATIVPQAVPLADPSVPVADAPLFASPVAQAIYIQVGGWTRVWRRYLPRACASTRWIRLSHRDRMTKRFAS